MESHEMESQGVVSHGVDPHGMDQHGMVGHGTDSHGVDSHGIDSNGTDPDEPRGRRAPVGVSGRGCGQAREQSGSQGGRDPPHSAEDISKFRFWVFGQRYETLSSSFGFLRFRVLPKNPPGQPFQA